nr:zinc-dependent metalloprotease family protein [uncultured Emticicia sp.]
MWQNIDSEPTIFGSKQINPAKYKVLKLDVASIKSFLNKTPLEFTASAKNVNTVLELPLPDGTFEEFVIVESPMMEAALAQKFPEIKTYSGYSLKNPATTVRLDFTQRGFHGMILSPEGTFFIDPYSTATVEYYISYNKKDFTSKKSFTCAVDQIKQPGIDTPTTTFPNKETNLPNGINASIGDGVLRNYRLALAATVEYTAFHGGTVALALAAQVTTMNRVNGVFLRDFAVKMNIIANNNLIIYTNATTDPYTNDDGGKMLTENINNLNSVIGSANFDIGHVFSTGGGGVAYLGSPCNSFKGGGVTGSGSPVGDAFDIDYVAHEMGHQFGGNHTQNNNCNRNSSTAFEPGSGYSIMGYAGICAPNVQNNSDAHFHGGNFSEMHTFITGTGNTCASKPTYSNAKPSITSNTVSQTIPKGTPFMLTGVATDADGNATLTYCWDQMDTQVATQPPVGTATGGPSFRGFSPTPSGTRYFPRLSDLVANVSPTWEVLPTVARSLNFRLVVRDNATGGGANDQADITLTIAGSAGPFIVNSPNNSGISYAAFSTQTITWAVASTDIAPVSCANVDILLSTDGGLTYPTTLTSNVPNSGSAIVTIPNVSSTTARIMVKGANRAFFDISNNNFTITSCTAPNTPTAVSVNNTNICSGSSVTLNATCASGTITWYNTISGGTALGTGTGFSQTPASTITYYASCENAICKSARVATSEVTTTNPTAVSVNNTNICSGTSVALNATCSSGTLTWYNALTGGTSLGTGTGLSQTPASTITYYASCENTNCISARVATSQVTVTLQPTNPTAVLVNNTNICAGNSVSLSGTCTTGTITWYNAISGGTALGTGTGLSQTPASTIIYYASCENAICKSARVATNQVTVTAQPTNPSTFNITNSNICAGNSVSLTASCSIGTVTWYNAATGGAALGTGTGLSQTPASTITYYASCENVNCKSSRVATSQVTVTAQPTNPTAVSVDNANICSGNSVSLSATCATGTITWYNTISGGTALGTGTGFSQTPTSTITYYASCENVTCKSDRVATNQATVTAKPINPSAVTVNNTNICAGSTVFLAATCATGTITWYNAISGGTALGTGTGFSQTPASTITYYASCEIVNCKSDRVATSQVTVTSQPTNPTAVSTNNSNICPGNSVSLNATCATGTITWYNAISGGTALGTGTGLSQTPASTITYYASCEIVNCKSARVATNQVIVLPQTNSVTSTISTGTSIVQAAQTIDASNKVISPAKVTYKAGNSISLNAGFEAQTGSVFVAQIQGCN